MDLCVDRRTFRLVLAVIVFTVAFIVLVTLVTVWSGATYYTNSVVNNNLPSRLQLSMRELRLGRKLKTIIRK